MHKTLQEALNERGYDRLTPVQEAVTNPDLEGKDLLVSAQTGSGKTLGFGLGIAPNLLDNAEAFGEASAPLALIIAPTRELALQVKRELAWLYAKAGGYLASCVGGMDMRDERRALARGAHIVVATPGRLRDHIMRGSIDLGQVRAVVLDEADEMLDLGFREDLEFILGEVPENRQTFMFSATVPASIAKLAQKYQRDAQRIVVKSEGAQHADIEYRAYRVADRDTENAIINTLRYFEAPNAIVFANTRAMVNRLTTRLTNRGFSVVALSGELSQSERAHALQAMRDGRARVCVATDVAARGIDLPNLDLVVHAELPSSHETLLHRSGRTGRAGRKGVSTLIVAPKDNKKAERITRFAKVSVAWSAAPSADDVRQKDAARIMKDPAWAEPTPPEFEDMIEQMVESFTPQQLAARFLQAFHASHTAPEEILAQTEKPAPRKQRSEFGPSVWFSISGGRKAGAEPRRLLPMVCKLGGLSNDEIGAIRIQQKESYVEIRQDRVADFLKSVGEGMKMEGGTLVQLDGKPDLEDSFERPANRGKPRFRDKPDTRGNSDRREKKPHRGQAETGNGNEPSKKKPKPDRDKPRMKAAHKSKAAQRAANRTEEAPASKPSLKPKRRPDTDRPKGPPPPKGKASSKKNRARTAAKKGLKGGKGGEGPPKGRSK